MKLMIAMAAFGQEGDRRPIYFGIIGLLLLLNGYLGYKNMQLKKNYISEAATTQITGLTDERDKLQVEYNETLAELSALQSESLEKDSTISQLKTQLEGEKAEIERILNKSSVTKRDLEDARARLAALKADTENYKRTIEQLTAQNSQLTTEKQELATNLEQEKTVRSGLEVEKSTLTKEKEELSAVKAKNEETINRGTILIAENLTASGVQDKKNGKEGATNNPKKMDKLKVCFDMLPNKIIAPGPQDVYLRLISPEGSTIAVQSLGSGKFKTDTGEEKQYTTKASINYKGTRQNYCVYWSQNFPFVEGNYNAEIYHKGNMIGSGNFELEKGLFK